MRRGSVAAGAGRDFRRARSTKADLDEKPGWNFVQFRAVTNSWRLITARTSTEPHSGNDRVFNVLRRVRTCAREYCWVLTSTFNPLVDGSIPSRIPDQPGYARCAHARL